MAELQFANYNTTEWREFKRIHKEKFWQELDLKNKKEAEKMIQKIVSMEERYILMCRNSFITEDMKENFESLIH